MRRLVTAMGLVISDGIGVMSKMRFVKGLRRFRGI